MSTREDWLPLAAPWEAPVFAAVDPDRSPATDGTNERTLNIPSLATQDASKEATILANRHCEVDSRRALHPVSQARPVRAGGRQGVRCCIVLQEASIEAACFSRERFISEAIGNASGGPTWEPPDVL